MATALVHFIAGSLGSLLVFLVFARLSGNTRFSAPFGVILIGIACASLAHFLSAWATPVVIFMYVLANAGELYQERQARKSLESSNAQK